MKRSMGFGLAAAGLVAGLVIGSIGLAGAATPTVTTAPPAAAGEAPGYGMRLGGAMRDAGGRLVDIVAKLTGLSVDDVSAQRQDGTSYKDIADSKGVSESAVVDEALKVRKELLDAKVKDGTISAETEKDVLERMETRLKDRVDDTGAYTPGEGRRGRGMGRGGRGGNGGGFGGNGACTQDGTGATTSSNSGSI